MIGHLIFGVCLAVIAATAVVLERGTWVEAAIAYVIAGSVYLLQVSVVMFVRAARSPEIVAETSEARVTPVRSESGAFRILAVDDDPLARDILNALLEQIDGVEVELCPSAMAAQSLMQTRHYDCFFLDIEMPGMDGVQLAKWVRGAHGDRKTPIVMATAMNDRRNVVEAFLVGANDYVTKPFDGAEIAKRVADARGVKHAPAVDLPDPTEAQPNGSVTTTASFRNYLAQLNRGGLFATNLFTVKVDLTACEKRGIASDAVNRTAETLRNLSFDRGYLLADAGNGVFIGAVNGPYKDLRDVFVAFPTEIEVAGITADLALTDVRTLRLPMPEDELLAVSDSMMDTARTEHRADTSAASRSA